MKIGIMTYHRALNYGAALQAFALTEYLRSEGYEAEVVNYKCERIESDYYKLIPSTAKSVRSKVSGALRFFKKKKRAEQFRFFEKNYGFVSKVSYDKKNIAKANDVYDVFISGSDQVWNNYGSDSDFNYFLKFAEESKRIIAYSASFGYEKIPEFLIDDYKRLLMRYDAISVREKSGSRIVNDLIGRDAYVTCDPVLLLDDQTWKDRLAVKREMDEKYLLCYFLATNQNALAYAVKYAANKGLKVVTINNIQKEYTGVEMLKNVSPEQFVSLFANAEAVMTDSFHGTVFSLTFNKPFNTFVSKKTKVNSRIENLLGRVGLFSHIVSDFVQSDWNGIDYHKVNGEIMKYRHESMDYLKKNLKS